MPAKLLLKDLLQIAKDRNGECLSLEYSGIHSKYIWKCDKFHIWEASLDSIKRGSWCTICAQQMKPSIHDMNNLAKSKGGVCLSSNYVNSKTHLDWQCDKNHVWKATPEKISNGKWCPFCARNVKLTINELMEIAINRGGECLSTEYINSSTNLQWKCQNNHTWFATATSIKHAQTWCPYCKNKIEDLCRNIFESIFNKPFIKIKPKWMLGPKGYPLELDGYNQELNLAFEVNGPQHYTLISKYKMSNDDLNYIKIKDQMKIDACKINNTNLIIIDASDSKYDFDKYNLIIKESIKCLNLNNF